jgi:sulfatase modifying factor 1
MKTQKILTSAAIAALITSASASVTIDWVTVGNAGNSADPLTGFGAVGYEYRIGKYEVTNAQYGAFLNAKGQSNVNNIYNPRMSSYGITQSGSSGSFTYSVTTALANRPVAFVSWYDAARFANWMMNGQGSGDMETGAYTLSGNTGIITKNAGAQVYIPTEDEWYKAAYYNGATSTYSLYPNGQNSITKADANYGNVDFTSTDVGTYSGAPSSYGTFDQGGNAEEWNDAINGYGRGMRGGGWLNLSYFLFDSTEDLLSTSRLHVGAAIEGSSDPYSNFSSIGFRLAAVPEPSSMLLTMLASGLMLIRRKR